MTKIVPQFSNTAMTVLCKRYFRPVTSHLEADAKNNEPCPSCGKMHETPEEFIERCSFGNEEYYNLLASLDFLPNSPTLFNAGTKRGTLSGCFKFNVEDSMESIVDVGRKAAFTLKFGGGTGYCLSDIRPYGKPISSTHGRACGPIAVLRYYHAIALMITQGGKREGAQMAVLSCDHEDVREFIHCKDKEPQSFGTFNLSVACTDEFMQKAAEGKNPLFDEMCESAWKTGDPGIYFIDTSERTNPTPWLGKLDGTNACIEENQLVITARGWIPIKEVKVDDLVLGHDERYHKVLRVILQGVRPTVDVILKTGKVIRCTPDHPFIIECGKVLAQNLKFIEPIQNIRRTVDITSSDYEEGFIDGSIYVDGSIGEHIVFCGPIETDVLRIANSLNKRFGCDINVRSEVQISGNTIYRAQTGKTNIVDYYNNVFCIEGVKNKSLDYQAGFLKGWFDSDGHTEINNVYECINLTIGERNSQGIREIWYILQNFGIPAKIYYVVRKGHATDEKYGFKNPTNSFRVQVGGRHYNVLADLIQWSRKSGTSYNMTSKVEVLAIRPSGEHVVYDLTVEDSHSFVVEGFKVSNCGEVPALNNEPCNLGSINLSHMTKDGKFDFERLSNVVKLATRYLDEVIDRNFYPDPEIEKAAKLTRKIGLGVMGWADVLALLHIDYASDVAITLATEVMNTIQRISHEESLKIGTLKGCYPAFSDKENKVFGTPKRRNAATTCIAPAGTISVIASCSSGIEPHFSLQGTRAMGDGTQLNDGLRSLKTDFTPQVAHDIDWSWHIKHQSAFQKYVDLAVSKTINLRETATIDDVRNAFIMAWKLGCKGITIYRDKSRDKQIMVSKGDESRLYEGHTVKRELTENYTTDEKFGLQRHKMTVDAEALRHKFSVGGMEGYIHIGKLPDSTPGELFITGSNQGSTVSGLLASLSIVTSMALQYGVPLETLVSKLQHIRFEPSGQTGNQEIPMASSVVAYIFRYMGHKFLNGKHVDAISTGMLCPECGAAAISEEGCLKCSAACGWSRC